MTSSSHPPIKLLSNDNWTEWSFLTKAALQEKKWSKYLNIAPTDGAFNKDDDQAAAGLIKSRLTISQHHLVRDPPTGVSLTAKEVWDRLVAAHVRSGSQMQLYHLNRIMYTPYVEGTKIEEHINQLREEFTSLASTGMEWKDDIQGGILLASLSRSPVWGPYSSTIVAATSAASPSALTFDYVSRQLLMEDKRRQSDDYRNGADAATALAAGRPAHRGTSGTGRSPASTDGRPRTCFNQGCKTNTTHTSDKCWHKHGYPEGHPRHKAKQSVARPTDRASVVMEDDEEAYLTVGDGEAALEADFPDDDSTLVWKVDSGATQHYCYRREWFSSYTAAPTVVTIANGSRIDVAGHGTIQCLVPAMDGKYVKTTLTGVQHAPSFVHNLLSVSTMAGSGMTVSFGAALCVMRNKFRRVVGVGHRADKLFNLTVRRTPGSAYAVISSPPSSTSPALQNATLRLWHERLGHAGHRAVSSLFLDGLVSDDVASAVAQGIGPAPVSAVHCEACVLGKHRVTAVPKSNDTRATRPLERVYMDVWGPAPTQTMGGHRYFLLIMDDYSRYLHLTIMASKGEALVHFKAYRARWESFHSPSKHVLAHVRSDNGGEFVSNDFLAYLQEHGIHYERTAAYTPQQNGVVERANGTVLNSARTIRLAADLPESFWGEACKTAVYTRNRTPTAALKGMTPYEAWTSEKPRVAHMRRFGALAYVHVPKKGRSKLNPRAIPCTFVGYSGHS